jgi:hypothetical protein
LESAAIVLAVVGGYIFSSQFRITQLRIAQAAGYELAFLSIIFAYAFFQLSCLALYPFFSPGWTLRGLMELWANPIENRLYLAVFADLVGSLQLFKENLLPPSIAAFFLGATLWHPANKVVSKRWKEVEILAYLVTRYGSELDKLLLNAIFTRRQVQITLDNGKVYAGKVVQLPRLKRMDRDPSLGLTLVVNRSGYRDERTHKLRFTTDYQWMRLDAPAEDLETFIPLNRIVSATFFDPDLYQRFQQQPAPDPEPLPPHVPFRRRYNL